MSKQIRSSIQKPFSAYNLLEPRMMMSADIYQPGYDSVLGVTINSFVQEDPRDSRDSYDIETGWLAAVEEVAQLGVERVNFAVYRIVQGNGNLTGGTAIETVQSAVVRARNLGLEVSVLPLFETQNGWRGDYNPTGQARTNFRQSYQSFLLELASVEGVDRLTVASELNAMVLDSSNNAFFDSLINAVSNSGFDGEIGFTANFDIYDTPALNRIWSNPRINFIGVSAYNALIAPNNYGLVSGTGTVSQNVLEQMTEAWNRELDGLTEVGKRHSLPVYLQEVGAVKENYSSIYPWAVVPGDFVDSNAPNRYVEDPGEQAAVYRSLMIALDGRGEDIKGADFWSWDHQADRGGRSVNQFGGIENRFSVWPTDNAGGSELINFLSTRAALIAVDDVFSISPFNQLDVTSNDRSIGPANIVNVKQPENGRVQLGEDGTLSLVHEFAESLIVGSDSAAQDRFGYSVAVDGDVAVIGAPFHDSKFRINNGAIYIYERVNQSWQEATKIVSPTDRSGGLFGWSVDIGNDRIVVGSMHDDRFALNSGAAYLYERGDNNSVWNLRQALDGSDVRIGDRFGVSVAIEGDLIAVGQRFGDGVARDSGSVSLFKPNASGDWIETDRVNSGVESIEQFGWDVELNDSRLAVGAPRGATGTAWLFQINATGVGTDRRELTSDDIGSGARFGTSVALSDSGVFVGAPLHDADGTINTGAVYQFDFSGQLVEKHTQNGAARGDQFGFDVSANGNSFAATAVGVDISGLNSGATFRFTSTNGAWVQQRLDTEGGIRAGLSVAIDRGNVLSGMVDEKGATPQRGSVKSFIARSMNEDVSFQYTISNAARTLDGNEDATFGDALSTHDRWAVVGAPRSQSAPGINGGAAVVFERVAGQWQYHSKLAPATLGQFDYFGAAVKVHGDTIVVGAYLSDESGVVDAGAAYVYELSGNEWALQTKLLAAGIDANDQFGYSIDVVENQIAIGAVFDEFGSIRNTGTVTLFEKQNGNWNRTAIMRPQELQGNAKFGYAIAIHEDRLVASATRANNTGKAYIFRNAGGWILEDSVVGDDSAAGDEFGSSVALSSQGLFVGAWKHDHNGIFSSGAVYHFARNNNTWSQSRKLVGSNEFDQLTAYDQFGSSLALSDGQLFVGANLDDSSGENSGSVFLFDMNQEFELKARFTGTTGSQAGKSLGFNNGKLLIGGRFANSLILVQDVALSTANVTVKVN